MLRVCTVCVGSCRVNSPNIFSEMSFVAYSTEKQSNRTITFWFPSLPLPSQLLFDMDKEIFPMVVQAVVDEGEGQYTLASCLYHSTFSWLSFPLKWASGCSELQSGSSSNVHVCFITREPHCGHSRTLWLCSRLASTCVHFST